MKQEILYYLKDHRDSFVSGEALSDILGISRTAVWKYINELKNEGYSFEASSRKGYRLAAEPDRTSALAVGYRLQTECIGCRLEYLPVVDSTNSYAKHLAAQGCKEGTVVLTECQTAGRGRLGRGWESPAGMGIWMSIVLRPVIAPSEVQIITLGASVAVVDAIRKVYGLETSIKWPNDVILHGKKVCGILTEMSMEMDRVNYLILGVGININHKAEDFPLELRDKAASLRMESGGGDMLPRVPLTQEVLRQLEHQYRRVLAAEPAAILEDWKQRSLTVGSQVSFTIKDVRYDGIANDITEDGRLVVQCSDGVERKLLSGEISVRGMLGYV